MLTDTDRAYIAGFFDGEGSISLSPKQAQVRIPQKDPTILEEIQELTAMGTLYYDKPNGGSIISTWVVYRQSDVVRFIRLIYPYVRCPTRRRKLRMAYYYIRAKQRRLHGKAA